MPETVGTLVVGSGQAGLAVGYHLRRYGLRYLIVDANQRIGDAWRHRWDSLRLFTASRHDALPGMPFPGSPSSFPTKDEVADYLEAYAERFQLEVRTGIQITRLSSGSDGFVAESPRGSIAAQNVVVAMGSFQQPRVPAFAGELDPSILQLHSSAYRNPSQLEVGGVLVVGAGNSGFEIALEVSGGHRTWLSGSSHLLATWHPDSPLRVIEPITWFVGHRLLTRGTPIGGVLASHLRARSGGPVMWATPGDVRRAGIERVGRVSGVSGGSAQLEDGRVLEVANVIWCTGFRTDLSWIDLPSLDSGQPVHRRGIVAGEPGLYFVGLFYQYSITSSLLGGVGRDAEHVVKAIAARAA